MNALPVEEIAKRLDDRFRILTGGARPAAARHRTLRATIDWSHNLLGEPQRVLLGASPCFGEAGRSMRGRRSVRVARWPRRTCWTS